MSGLCPLPSDHVILDYLVTVLTAYSTTQEALQPGVGFTVRRDQTRPYTGGKFPLVNVWSGDQGDGFVSTRGGEESATITLDLYTKIVAAAVPTGAEQHADQKSLARLYYLREQVKRALFDNKNFDFGLPVGSLRGRPKAVWKLFLTEHGFPDETVLGGRITLDMTYAWTPEDSAQTIDLAVIGVTETRGAFGLTVNV